MKNYGKEVNESKEKTIHDKHPLYLPWNHRRAWDIRNEVRLIGANRGNGEYPPTTVLLRLREKSECKR